MAGVTLLDALGVLGVGMVLVAYAWTALGGLDPKGALALLLNLVGSLLILWTLVYDFNLSAALMEASWALVALAGLIKGLAVGRFRRPGVG